MVMVNGAMHESRVTNMVLFAPYPDPSGLGHHECLIVGTPPIMASALSPTQAGFKSSSVAANDTTNCTIPAWMVIPVWTFDPTRISNLGISLCPTINWKYD
jgi:hypothetical protein